MRSPAAEVVAATDDHGQLDPEIVHLKQFVGELPQAGWVHSPAGRASQGLPAELDHDTRIATHVWPPIVPYGQRLGPAYENCAGP